MNGAVVGQSSGVGPLETTSGAFTIGGARIGGSATLDVYYTGYIDHLTISNQTKSSCEIYLDAILACYLTFDSAVSLVDSGPNFLNVTNNGGTIVSGRVNQALQFSSSLSYFTVSGISALKSQYTVFTISMWVYPTNIINGATLIHASTLANGLGTCLTMWGLTPSRAVSVNVMNSSNVAIAATSSVALPLNVWTHILQTSSPTNGNRLYINGVLVASVSVSSGTAVGPYVFIGASPTGTNSCPAGSIVPGQFYGAVDEYRVFGRELTTAEICRLANP
ncbi:unnamed protein product [Rotaria sp. Silwood1]|nr:unnamed protein product [Rotaria sp. Silwood1]CAF1420913.1 unnamed protein product [Rotaria sp. Silwood1]CAF1424497.1 unnamed protein product [Rotaria sp. Silwood1]CAF3634653.1 unnamed protein product [Rotaria sp. Silwood1]CAF3644384.1 unnamed protein product [Rotaria sp. Silwood1]